MAVEEELLLQRIPHDTFAEQSVLGAMLVDAQCIPRVMEDLHSEDFYLPMHREIFDALHAMFALSQPIDPVTLLDEMRRRGVLRDDSQHYLLQLMDVTPTAAHVDRYISILLDKALLRRLGETGSELSEQAAQQIETGQTLLDLAEQKIYALRQGRDIQGLEPIAAILPRVLDRLNELAAADSEVPGLATGFSHLDQVLAGLGRGELILLAARPGMGKTAFALNVLLHAGKYSGKAAVFFSLEMTREQLVLRLIASESFLDHKRLITGKLRDDDWDKVVLALSALERTQIFIDDNPSLSVADMNAKCRRVKNLGLVVVDYLQLMQAAGSRVRPGSGENRQQVVADISRALKIMSKELGVPVLCLSQLSRANESRSDKRPMLSDLRESGAIEQDADVVMFLYRDDYYNKESEAHNIAECIIAKNRRGETPVIQLQWLPEFTAFSTLERRYEDENS